VRRDDSGQSVIALTLLRCVGWLSRTDLACRQGNAGPAKPTTDAQQQGSSEFEYSFIPFSPAYMPGLEGGLGSEPEPLNKRAAVREARSFCAPVRALATDLHDGPLPSSASWVSVVPPSFVLTAIKPPEEGEGIVIRGFNSSDAPVRVQVRPLHKFSRAEKVNLNEDPVSPLEVLETGEVAFPAGPREIVTLRFTG
jgi:alpha-mannosidase